MGRLTEQLSGKRVYFDTNIIIYLVEGFTGFSSVLDELQQLLALNACSAVTSELTLTETLVKPFKDESLTGITVFRSTLEQSEIFQLKPTTREIHIDAAKIAAHFSLKVPDAIHVATAKQCLCDVFLTNDKGIRVPDGIERILLSEYIK